MFSSKHQDCIRKELEDLQKAIIIQIYLSPCTSLIVIVATECPPDSEIQETERLCVDYRRLNLELPSMLGSKSSRAVTLVDIKK